MLLVSEAEISCCAEPSITLPSLSYPRPQQLGHKACIEKGQYSIWLKNFKSLVYSQLAQIDHSLNTGIAVKHPYCVLLCQIDIINHLPIHTDLETVVGFLLVLCLIQMHNKCVPAAAWTMTTGMP